MGALTHNHRDLSGITAVILAGGKGTRLQSVLQGGQKVVAPVAGKPFLAHLLAQLEASGVRKCVLCVGFQAQEVRESLGDSFGQIGLTYATEDQPLGTAGALRNALPHIDSDVALVLNGDSHCPCDFAALLAARESHDAAGAILLTHVEDASPYGAVETNDAGHIIAFHEKGQSGPGWVNAGIYALKRDFIQSIPENETVSIETRTFPGAVRKGLCIIGYQTNESLLDIGVPERYAEAGARFGMKVEGR